MVRRDFHQERARFAFKCGSLQHKACRDSNCDTDKIKREHQILTIHRPESGCKKNVDRKSCSAAHERSHENCRDSIGFLLHRARRHNGRNTAAETNDQRNEGFAGKSERTHKAIHNESGSRHVARILKEGKREEHARDHRHKCRDTLNTAANTVGKNGLKPFRSAKICQQLSKSVNKDRSKKDIEEIYKR